MDFIADPVTGQLTRFFVDGMPKKWPAFPLTIIYPAGYDPIPGDIQEAALLLIKMRYFGKTRDPLLRSDTVDVLSESFFGGSGPGSSSDLPVDVAGLLDRYRVPVIA